MQHLVGGWVALVFLKIDVGCKVKVTNGMMQISIDREMKQSQYKDKIVEH